MVWMVMVTMTLTLTLPPFVIELDLNWMRCLSHCSCQSIGCGSGVWAVILSNLLQILSITYVHRIPESKCLLISFASVPSLILSHVMLHCYNSSNTSGLNGIQFTSCSSVSVFFKRWASMSLQMSVLIPRYYGQRHVHGHWNTPPIFETKWYRLGAPGEHRGHPRGISFEHSFTLFHHIDLIIKRPHTSFSKSCHLNQCLSCAVLLPALSFSWLSGNDWARSIQNFNIGHGSVCTGCKNITSGWTILMPMSLPWVGLCFLITQLLNHTMCLPYASHGSSMSGIQYTYRDPRKSCSTL